MIIRLSPFWLDRARQVGIARQAYAHSRRMKDYGTPLVDPESAHVTGALTEAGLAKALGRPWLPNVGNLYAVDVDGVAEARGRRVPGRGIDLAIRPHDKDDKPYVLLHLYPDQSMRLIGWLYGGEAKERGGIWSETKRTWFVRGPYRSTSELISRFAKW